jgi:hypothetical protein
VKKPYLILFFVCFLLSGYSCQIGRFFTAFQQINTTHCYEKGLTKRVLGLRNIPLHETTQKLEIKKNKLTAVGFTSVSPFSFNISAEYSVFTSVSAEAHSSPPFFYSGKRGPPCCA